MLHVIAALGFGTATIPQVRKIVGPNHRATKIMTLGGSELDPISSIEVIERYLDGLVTALRNWGYEGDVLVTEGAVAIVADAVG